MNTGSSSAGGWRDSQLRKNWNAKLASGTIWNTIQSTDFKNNIMPVLKTTNNSVNKAWSDNNDYKPTITVDKLFILSPSEMGMPIIKKYKIMGGCRDDYQLNANVHYYNSNTYKNTIKSSRDGNISNNCWNAAFNYIYDGDAYQWWMLPAGSRKMSNGNQSYHNTDTYSYCTISSANRKYNPSTDIDCHTYMYYLRSTYSSFYFAYFDNRMFLNAWPGNEKDNFGVVVSFSF